MRVNIPLVRPDENQEKSEPVVLNMFEDLTLTAMPKNFSIDSSLDFSWQGRILEIDLSSVTIVVKNGALTAEIVTPEFGWAVRPVQGDISVIYEIDPGAQPAEAPPLSAEPWVGFVLPDQKAPDSAEQSAGCLADNRKTLNDDLATVKRFRTSADDSENRDLIDVMVLYTSKALAAAGSVAAMDALIALAVSQANQAYENSGVDQRLRLVHSENLADRLGDSGNIYKDLNDLIASVYVQGVREENKADLTALFIEQNDMGVCGLSYIMDIVSSAFESKAYSVIRLDCSTAKLSFVHELGHLMGARHDCYSDSQDTPYEYAHGFVNVQKKWRTIMAYNAHCSELCLTDCNRILYFSNPNLTYQGTALGGAVDYSCNQSGDGGSAGSSGGGGGCFIEAASPLAP